MNEIARSRGLCAAKGYDSLFHVFMMTDVVGKRERNSADSFSSFEGAGMPISAPRWFGAAGLCILQSRLANCGAGRHSMLRRISEFSPVFEGSSSVTSRDFTW